MYYSYFGLTESPFSIAPNPNFLFMTQRHQEALAHLYHGIESDAGFVLLTGDVGTGKTTVCRRFLSELPDNTKVAFILNPCINRVELLLALAKELEIDVKPSGQHPTDWGERQLISHIHECLLANHAQGINTVLLIDEAQQLDPQVVEFLRLLTNLETNQQKLLKIILVGQPELNDMLARPELSQLSQRITARYHIYPLNPSEIASYIAHRLNAAGYSGDVEAKKIFSPRRIKQLFKMTQGIPRLINVVCDRALLGAYASNQRLVTRKILNNAFRDVQGNYRPDTTVARHRHATAYVIPQQAAKKVRDSRLFMLTMGVVGIALGVALSSVFFNSTRYSFQAMPHISAAINELQAIASGGSDNNKTAHTADGIVDSASRADGTGFVDRPSSSSVSPLSVTASSPSDTQPTTVPVAHTAKDEFTNVESIVERIESAEVSDSDNVEPIVHTDISKVTSLYYEDNSLALRSLLGHIVPTLPRQSTEKLPCDQLVLTLWRCDTERDASWELFEQYNRPAVVSVLHQAQTHFLVVVGLNNTHATVIAHTATSNALNNADDNDPMASNPAHVAVQLPLEQLQQQWLGEFTFVWQAPPGFQKFIYKTASPLLINWLANAFATLDNQDKVLAEGAYNSRLEKRIRLFQRNDQLKEDGKAGVETLLKLNEYLGIATTLQNHYRVANKSESL